MAAALGGLDVLVFTGGVGERAAEIRARAMAGLEFLGLGIDEERNASATPDRDVSAPDARTATLVLRAREDRVIAAQVRSVLLGPAASGG